jgi:hypothetical protein
VFSVDKSYCLKLLHMSEYSCNASTRQVEVCLQLHACNHSVEATCHEGLRAAGESEHLTLYQSVECNFEPREIALKQRFAP